jgi:hypothetical protein
VLIRITVPTHNRPTRQKGRYGISRGPSGTAAENQKLSAARGAPAPNERNTESESAVLTTLLVSLAVAAQITAAPPTSGVIASAVAPRIGVFTVALNPNAFAPDSQNESDQMNQQRRNRLNAILGQKSGGLGSLFAGTDDDTSDLSTNPLKGGDTSSPLATPNQGAQAVGAPSALATENVPRTPVVNFTSTPILTGQQQGDAAVSEAQRGEVGQIGGTGGTPRMDTAARNTLLQNFFGKPTSPSDQQPAQTAQDRPQQDQQPSDTAKAFGAAKSALTTGGKLKQLFSTGGFGEVPSTSGQVAPDFPLAEGMPTQFSPTNDMIAPDFPLQPGQPTQFQPNMEQPATPSDSGGFSGGVTPGAAGGIAGGLMSLIGGATGNKGLQYGGQAASIAAPLAQTAATQGAEAAANGAVGGAATMGFGLAAGATNAAASQYISERMGPIAGQITNTLSNLASIAGPVGMAAGMFLSGIMGAISSGFSSPVYAEHRNEAVQSIQRVLPVIADALPHIHTEQDFAELQQAVNSLAQRWSLNSGGITGGYEAGGQIGAQFNPLFTQALPLLEQRGYQPGDQQFGDWFKNYALQRMAGEASFEPGFQTWENHGEGGDTSVYTPDSIRNQGMGNSLAGVLGVSPAQMDAYLRAKRPDLYDLLEGRTAPPGSGQWTDIPSYNSA